MGNLRDEDKLRNMQPTDVVLGADEDGCLVNFPPDNFSGSIPITIDTETGDGEELFTEPSVNDFLFKKLKSNDESVDVTTDVDGNINLGVTFPTPPTVDYPVNGAENVKTDDNAVGIYKQLSAKKIQLKSLVSEDIIISEVGDDIKFSLAGGGSSSNDYYLDVNFIRPSNWLEKAELIDSIATAKGTLNDPFKDFDEYLRRTVGEIGGSNVNGAYSRVNPKQNKTLQVLSTFETDKVLEINNNSLYFKNKSLAIYTGSEEYGYNTERLWNAMPKTSGILNRSINCEIKGEGGIVNKFHSGAVCHMTSEGSTTASVQCYLALTAMGEGLNFTQTPESNTYTGLTLADGTTPFLHAGVQVQGSTQKPTTPILKFKGKNTIGWGAVITGTKTSIISNTQSFIEVTNTGSLTVSTDELSYLVNAFYIGYQKKLYTGLAGMTADEIEILGAKDLFFKPYVSRNIFSSLSGSQFEISNISTGIDPRTQIAINSIFNIRGSSLVECRSSFREIGGGSAVSFMNVVGDANTIILNGTNQASNNIYFVKGDGTNTVNVTFVNSNNNTSEIIKKDVTALNVYTNGTWSSIKSIPINTGIVSFVDNAEAVSAGYITGMSYFNTTENAVSRVS